VTFDLPEQVVKYLPAGRHEGSGVWLVLPDSSDPQRSVAAVNKWLRAEDWYPHELEHVVWFGDDGTGNFFGWDPLTRVALLWNPEDGAEPWRKGSVEELWRFVLTGYTNAP